MSEYEMGKHDEQERIKNAWQIERFECECESPMDHLLKRIEGEE